MDGLGIALLIFVLRIINNAVTTMRIVFIARHQRGIATILAFIESSIFAVTVANVVNDLTNPLIFIAYSGGFAIGSYVGISIEQRFVKSFKSISIILTSGGHELALLLRDAGFGVTETSGEGKDGTVTMLRIIVDGRDVTRVLDISRENQPDAFIAIEEARTIRQGYFRSAAGRLQ